MTPNVFEQNVLFNPTAQTSSGFWRQIEEGLADGRVDLGIVSLAPPPELGEFHALFEVPLGVVAKADDPAVRGRTIPFARFVRIARMKTPNACFTRTIHMPGLGSDASPAPAIGHGIAIPRPRQNGSASATFVPVA